MKMRFLFVLLISVCELPVAIGSEDEEFFESRVRPLLVKRCYQCHRRQAEGGLRLDSLAAMKKGGASGPAIVPGDAEASLLWKVVSGQHDDLSMPPDEPLNPGAAKVFQKWINDGAAWPMSLSSSRAAPDRNGITQQERSFWSFQPVQKVSVPSIDGSWGDHPIDALIAQSHRRQGLVAGEIAAPAVLIRRLSFDLTGLPPSPQEIAEFRQQSKRDPHAACRALVERLLASRHYGERWAQHWLDLVRYADTAGDAADFPIPEAYKYRNYVIDAFNRDLPYDQFVRQQIAGDLMPCEDDAERWRRVIATGYIAISRRIGVSPHNQRHIMIEDTLNNLGKTFLGLTVGCARCHDHKFDPIPTTDYYALYGIFDSTLYPHAGAEHRPYRSDFVYRVGKENADRLLAAHYDRLEGWRKEERAAFERYRDFQRKPINVPGYNRDVAWREVLDLRERIREVVQQFPNLETALAVSEGDVGDANVHKQGDPKDRGPVVRRGFLQILGGQTLAADEAESGRMQLADWIVDADNPLTARVIVNRVWHHHFGRGLVTTTSDFGVRGSLPSHPQLLDFLARYLMDHDWSIKQLHRLIVRSRTYRLASTRWAANIAIDPENIFLWRGNRRRLDAEQLRDSILVFADRLDRSPGGRHPFPHRLTYFYRQHEPFVGDFPSQRRTIYLFRQRIRKNRFLDMFDGPDGNLHLGTRRPTTTSLQSLYMMNSEFIAKHCGLIAERIVANGDSHQDQVRWAYQHLFGRDPGSEEERQIESQLDRIAAQLPSGAPDRAQQAWASVVKAMLASNEFLFID